jgi:hypothetical protein
LVNEGSFGGKDAVSHRMAMLDPVAKDHAVGTGSEPMIVREPALERFDVCTAFCQPVESITKSLPGLRGLFPCEPAPDRTTGRELSSKRTERMKRGFASLVITDGFHGLPILYHFDGFEQ